MENPSSLQSMIVELRQSQQSLLDILSQADEQLLYQRKDEQEWTLAENLAHVAEARTFFVAEARKALASPGATIGRTVSHPGRLQTIIDHGQDGREQIAERLEASYAQVLQLLEQMSQDDLQTTGTHVKYGIQTLAEFIDHFIVEHDQNHVQQAQALARPL